MRHLWGILLTLLSATAFGCIAIFVHYAYAAGAGVGTILFLRFSIAAAVLLGYVLVRRIALPRGRNLVGLALIGGVGFVLQSACFIGALTMAPAGLVSVLLYLYPSFVTILMIVFMGEPPTRAKLAALAIATLGTALTVGVTLGGQALGIVLAVTSAVFYACYVVAGGRIMEREEAIPACTVILSAAALVFASYIGVTGGTYPTAASGWYAIVALALVSTVLSVVTLFAGIKLIGAVSAATLSTWEPVVTTVLAAILLNDAVQPLQIVGGSLILVAVIVLAREGSEGAEPVPEPENPDVESG